jgi:regulatory protein
MARWQRAAAQARERSDDPGEAVQHGLRLLSRRARTEQDLRGRLDERFTAAAVASALRRLRELGYVDDCAWAATYVQRPRSSLRSARLLRSELRAKGIDATVAEAATALHDDERAALAAARVLARKVSSASNGSGDARARRLYSALARRGFDSQAIQRALWRLRTEEPVLDP